MSAGDERSTASDPPRAGGAHAGERAGDVIGPYRLLSTIGEGGFGVVWLAERREPMVQRVALKIIKAGMDSKTVVARFEQERRSLAVMDHPNVARVFDGGVTPAAMGGRPYFVMEHVQGEAITEYCDRHTMTVRQRLELFVPVCEAVQHAHHKGIIHRDIKPSNILVEVRDGRGIPKVIDFGVAKAVRHTLTGKTVFTEQGQLIGTPEYMSPEQAEMGALDVDTRTDVYALGVVLYELLAGLPPFEAGELRGKGYAEIQRIIREVSPPTPSKRLTTVAGDVGAEIARKRQARLQRLTEDLRHELEWIPLRAIRKDRTERYATPIDLADDIRAFLEGRPLRAGPETGWYRARKFVSRRRGLVGAAAAVVVSLAAGTVVSTVMYLRANAARAKQQALSEDLLKLTHSLISDVHDRIAPLPGAAPVQRTILEHARDTLEPLLRENPNNPALILETAVVYDRLGNAQGNPNFVNLGNTEAALASYARAGDLMERLARLPVTGSGAMSKGQIVDAARDVVIVHTKIGDMRMATGRPSEALAEYRSAQALAEEVDALHPGTRVIKDLPALCVQKRADALDQLGDLAGAEAAVREALTRRRALAAADLADVDLRRDVGSSLQLLGNILRRSDRLTEALRCHQDAIDIAAALRAERPLDAGAMRDLGVAEENMGDALVLRGRIGEGLACFERAASLTAQLAKMDATDVRSLEDTARVAVKVGDAGMLAGDAAGAARKYAESLAIREPLYRKDPGMVQAARGLFVARAKLADALTRLGRPQDALAYINAAREFADSDAGRAESDAETRLNLVLTYQRLSFVQLRLRRADDALASAQESLRLSRRALEAAPSDALARNAVTSSLQWVGYVLTQTGKPAEALEHFRLALPDVRRRRESDASSADAERDLAMLLNNIASMEEELAKQDGRARAERAGLLRSAAGGYREAAGLLEEMRRRGVLSPTDELNPEKIAGDAASCDGQAAKLAGPAAP